MKLKCKAKGGKFNRGRCIAMQKRYRFNKFCKKGKRGQVCRIIRSCRRGQARSKFERMKCRRIYKRWRVSWMSYQSSRRMIRRSYKWRTTRRIREVVRRRRMVKMRMERKRRMMRRRIIMRRRMIARKRMMRMRLIRRRRSIRRRLMRRKMLQRRQLLRRQRLEKRKRMMW